MNFNEWLSMDEGRWKGPVGGAFGNSGRRPPQRKPVAPAPKPEAKVDGTPLPIPPGSHAPNPARTPPPTQRHDNRFQDYDARVQYGKSIEQQIFDSLVGCGLKLRPPSTTEDKYDKIDGWWDTGAGVKPIQIKYRDTGDDILFEVMKDYDRRVPGRDMIGKAEFYAVLSKTGGKIVMVNVAEAKQLIEDMVRDAEAGGFDERGNYRQGGAMLRIRPDPRTNQDKLMAYILVNMLRQVIPPCQAKVNF